MRRSGHLWVLILVSVCLAGHAGAATRDLGFSERVRAQEAIERAIYSHQIDATRSFEQALPRSVLEDKVRTYLAQSALLESVWNTPVTAEMLELELLRMTSRTRLPDRLDELFAALDHDPFLILECLVRPKLVDRLSRKLFTDDAQMHSAALDEARRVRGELSRGDLDPTQPHPARRAVELTRRTDDARVAEIAVPNPLELDSDAFDRWRELAPKAKGAIGPLMGERDAFTIRIVLDEDPDRARIATYAFAKRSWDDWWLDSSASADTDAVRAVADGSLPLPPVTGDGAPACAGAGWSSGVLEDMPDRRVGHVAVWTGNEMIVWGGSRLSWWTNTGMRYDPSTDSWTATSLVGAPSARAGHAGVWTGSELIVWGAAAGVPGGISFDDTGGRYDPLTDSWSPTSLTGVPVPRSDPTAVWTGDVAIFWGGYFLGEDVPPCNCCDGGNGQGCDNATCESIVCGQDSFCCNVQWDVLCDDLATSVCTCCEGSGSGPVKTGGRYDPDTDSWTSTSLLGAPTGRSSHTAVWTGAEMIVWGGFSGPSVNTGGRYDPFLDTWFATSMAGVPIARTSHVAVWTGNEMIVWGGAGGGSAQNTGGRYLPNSNSWLPVTLSGAPQGRSSHTAVWDGDEMIVWGGNQVSEVGNTGGRYNPSTNSWTPTATTGAPNGRYGHSMIWTGSEVIVWGGSPNWANGFYELLDTGGRYDPGTDSWAPTFASDAPQNRSAHTAVWTGNEMIIWGGGITNTKTLQVSPTGGLYDPATDSWSPTRLSGAPDARIAHTAVWTGDEMIVWGGYTDFDTTSTGGRYDPITNQWTPTSITGAQERSGHSAVWTGGEMFVWGGSNQNTGDRYDPLADDWTPISVVDAPTARSEHTAVWTGGKMIVWGGYGGGPQNTGGIYHPLSDFWTPTTTVGAPQERSEHSAVWTGEEMIVWGGAWPGATGGRYNPIADQWSEVTTDGAPADYYWHTSVWTGNRMIVWGGGFGEGQTGGYYDPLSDSWEPTVTTGAPDGRSRHSAVWTGEAMIVWGGNGQGGTFADGGIYDPDGEDLDGDGYGCELDCDDDDASVFGAPVEIVDVRFRSSTVLRWPSANPSTGESTVYDVVRGVASELPVGGGISETCLAPGYDPPGVGDQVQLQDTDQPSTGETFWYLIRATNPCGIGSYGATSQAVERQTSICP